MRAKFIKGLRASDPITLKLVVSMENKRQTGEDFLAFVELVNKHNKKRNMIKKVEIILSCYLQRHYVGEQKTVEIRETWEKNNEISLKENLQVPFEIIPWNELCKFEKYSDSKKKVDNLYTEDTAFQTIVNNLAKQHSHKADHQSAVNYLLEECAGLLSMDGDVAYPSTSLNGAVSYMLEKFKSSLIFHGYMLIQPQVLNSVFFKHKNQNKETMLPEEVNIANLLQVCLELSELMSNAGINNLEKQANYFKDFIELTRKYANTDIHQKTKEREGYEFTG